MPLSTSTILTGSTKFIAAIGAGTASKEVVQRYAKELYYLGVWMTPEFALLVANAPDR